MYRKEHTHTHIYRVWYSPWFWASPGGLGKYPLQISGATVTILYNHRKEDSSKTFGLTVRWKQMSNGKPIKLTPPQKKIINVVPAN